MATPARSPPYSSSTTSRFPLGFSHDRGTWYHRWEGSPQPDRHRPSRYVPAYPHRPQPPPARYDQYRPAWRPFTHTWPLPMLPMSSATGALPAGALNKACECARVLPGDHSATTP